MPTREPYLLFPNVFARPLVPQPPSRWTPVRRCPPPTSLHATARCRTVNRFAPAVDVTAGSAREMYSA